MTSLTPWDTPSVKNRKGSRIRSSWSSMEKFQPLAVARASSSSSRVTRALRSVRVSAQDTAPREGHDPCRRAALDFPGCPRSVSARTSSPPATSRRPSSSSIEAVGRGDDYVTLLGATGTGKTFTVAHVVEKLQRPTLVIAPNKSLGAQLANEFREVFPDNAVEYFVSYYDYYQPEAYLPTTDTYIEKDSSVNEEIERLRHAATAALLSRRDVLIVASVSCIYGLGSPEEYQGQILRPYKGTDIPPGVRHAAPGRHPVQAQQRRAARAARSACRATRSRSSRRTSRSVPDRVVGRHDRAHHAVRPGHGGAARTSSTEITIFPATHYVAGEERMKRALVTIEEELHERLAQLESQGKLLEAERLRMRTSLRPRDDARGRVLQRHRELLAAHRRARGRAPRRTRCSTTSPTTTSS